MSINIGMSEAQRKTIAEGLAKVLADSYTLYLKTHKFHWNVEGPMFRTLHLMFEEQYTELATAPTANSPPSPVSKNATAKPTPSP